MASAMDASQRHGSHERLTVGPYRLLGILAHGRIGRLYLATRPGDNQVVVLKTILPAFAQTPAYREMLLYEGRVAVQLDHPHIVATHEVGNTDGECAIIMEYLCGENLRDALRASRRVGARMPIDVSIPMAVACADALAYAHARPDPDGRPHGLVHGNVNPSNIVITYSGTAKLINFGIAQAVVQIPLSEPAPLQGKPSYASPEQVSGGKVDGRADIFALGVVLWESLTSTRLFPASTEALALKAVSSKEIPPPSSLRIEVPKGLDAVVVKALERSRAARFADATAFAEALLEVVPDARTPTAADRVARWMNATFGERRATLKRQVASGHQVAEAIRELRSGNGSGNEPARLALATTPHPYSDPARPKRAGSTDRPGTALPSKESSHPAFGLASINQTDELRVNASHRRRWLETNSWIFKQGLAAVPLVVLAISGIVVALSMSPKDSLGPARMTTLEVESEPPGASIFLDGEPTGMRTPAKIRSLAPHRKILVGLAKPGFASAERRVQLQSDAVRIEKFALTRSTGAAEFRKLPNGASVYVDGQRVETTGGPLQLPIGVHDIRVETQDELLFEGKIEIVPGTQVVDLTTGTVHE